MIFARTGVSRGKGRQLQEIFGILYRHKSHERTQEGTCCMASQSNLLFVLVPLRTPTKLGDQSLPLNFKPVWIRGTNRKSRDKFLISASRVTKIITLCQEIFVTPIFPSPCHVSFNFIANIRCPIKRKSLIYWSSSEESFDKFYRKLQQGLVLEANRVLIGAWRWRWQLIFHSSDPWLLKTFRPNIQDRR